MDLSRTVEFTCDLIEAFIKIFRISTFTATNNALVELRKRTKIQVCISMNFNAYNMSALNISDV